VINEIIQERALAFGILPLAIDSDLEVTKNSKFISLDYKANKRDMLSSIIHSKLNQSKR